MEIRSQQIISRTILTIILIVILGQREFVFASILPGSGGALLLSKKVELDKLNSVDSYHYSFLREIAEFLAKNGLPPGFFINFDEKGILPGIDLRPIVLYEAGVLKSPACLFTPKKIKKDNQLPSVSLHNVSDMTLQFPGTDLQNVEKDTAGRSDKDTGILNHSDKDKESVSFDFNNLQKQLNQVQPSSVLFKAVDNNPSLISLAVGTEVGQNNNFADNLFRLWTIRQAIHAGNNTYESSKPNYYFSEVDKEAFNGSFVVVVPGAVKAIEGRDFFLKAGKALVVSKGKPILVIMASVKVSVEPGATAIVEYIDKNTVRVRALASQNQCSVGVHFQAKNKQEEVRLLPGDELVVSTTKLYQQYGFLAENNKNSLTNWLKGHFSLAQVAKDELLLKTDLPDQDPEEKATIEELKKHL